MTCFDCKVCFGGSKFTSSAEGRKFNWLIYDSMTSLFACGWFSKSRGLSASVSFLPSFPFPFPLFYSLHSSPCNSLLPNCTETLAKQATFWESQRKLGSQNGKKLSLKVCINISNFLQRMECWSTALVQEGETSRLNSLVSIYRMGQSNMLQLAFKP